MEVLERLASSGIVPVVVIENADDAVPTAKALLAGGVDVMEITFRTKAAAESIKRVSEEVPEMLVGAGTIISLDQCISARENGAQFIVSPGYDDEVVTWCEKNSITIAPGCVTPTEIMMALKHKLHVLKFFPAGVYGGLSAMKALAGPFAGVSFIPTGGVNQSNVSDFAESQFVYAVGGSWICSKKDISEHNWEKITSLSKAARMSILGFEVAHIGINTDKEKDSINVVNELSDAFGFDIKNGKSSNFASNAIEVMNSQYLGIHGHIAIKTNRIFMAIAELERKGYQVDLTTAKYKGEKMIAVYLKESICGYAIHLLQK